MSFELTDAGITIQTFQEIYDELVAGYEGIYGGDISTDSDSPDGQRIAIEAKQILDSQSFALAAYNSLDPDFSSGEALNRLIKLSGIVRRPATLSQADLDIATDRNLTLSSGYKVQDTVGQLWETTADRDLVTGVNSVTVVAVEFGAIEATAGTITEPSTIVIGVTSITNPADATVGEDEETDAELRVRRNKSLASPATSTLGGIFSAIGNLSGVTDLITYENDSDTYDSDLELDGHSVWAVVEGGTVADIIEVLAKNKTGGTAIKGDEVGTYTETLTSESGITRSIVHTLRFDRPLSVDLYVRLNATRKVSTDPVPTDLIKSYLADREFLIAENAMASDLYRNVYEAGTNFIPSDLEVSLDGITWTDGRLLVGAQGKFSLETANITVTEIV